MRHFTLKSAAAMVAAAALLAGAPASVQADDTEDLKLLTLVCTAVYTIQLEQGTASNVTGTTAKRDAMRSVYQSVAGVNETQTNADVQKAKDLVKSKMAADATVLTNLVQTCDTIAEG